ncbi:MAG: sulfur carrier protein ThiS [Ruminococcus sp.]|nr:sulfur carrier protein ThiS [Ruminococcus sp.]
MVRINGEDVSADGVTIAQHLEREGSNPARVAVMINGEILPKAQYDTKMNDGDEVEIVGFVGGG